MYIKLSVVLAIGSMFHNSFCTSTILKIVLKGQKYKLYFLGNSRILYFGATEMTLSLLKVNLWFSLSRGLSLGRLELLPTK